MIDRIKEGARIAQAKSSLAHKGDPDTAHAAGHAAEGMRAGHHAKIIDALARAPDGYTAHEIAEHCDLDAVQVNRRLHELRTEGEVRRTEQKRRTPNGANARVYKISGRP